MAAAGADRNGLLDGRSMTKAELDRLCAENDEIRNVWREENVRLSDELDRLRTENAELKQKNGMLKARSHRIGIDVTVAFTDNERLRAENAELKNALYPFALAQGVITTDSWFNARAVLAKTAKEDK